MGNCLVTKLKGAVDNSSLKKLGEARFSVKAGSGSSDNARAIKLIPMPGKTITVSVIGSVGSFTVSDDVTVYTTYQLSDEKTIVFSEEATPYEVAITSKYDIYQFEVFNPAPLIEIRMSEFLYCNAYLFIPYNSIVEDYNIADILTMPNVYHFVDEMGHCEGDLSVLAGRRFSHINLQGRGPGQGAVTGDINYVASDILNRVQFVNTHVTGSVESFVATMLEKGHATLPFNGPNYFQADQLGSYITFGGELHPECDGAGILQFESTSRILLGVGSYEVANCTTIIVKGATASEIAAWEGAGKTVTVIS